MKKFPPKNFFPGIGLGIAVGLGVAAVILGDRLTAPISGLSFGRSLRQPAPHGPL